MSEFLEKAGLLEKDEESSDIDTSITFADLWLSQKILKKIEEKWYKYPSAIQAVVIPLLLNWNKDIIWQAQTWTWKTAAFSLPVLERIDLKSNNIQTLVLTPTRELAIQVANEIKSFADDELKIQLLYGWQNIRDEIFGLKRNPHIVVWTPWRVIDHLTKKNTLNIDKIKYFILDEADEMLNIWFKEDIEQIMEYTPAEKKVLLFSATMPKGIQDIVHKYIKDHDKISIEKKELTNSNIVQKIYKIADKDKFEALCRIIEIEFDFYWILFCKTKVDVDEVASKLMSRWYKVEWIHWDVDQKQREKTLARFKNWTIKILVATDVAARWIDVNNLTHVINYTLPDNPETYTHRIWRTGRAWNKWEAISFVSRRDLRTLMNIERVIKSKIKEEKLPCISELIDLKKKRLIDNTKEIIENQKWSLYLDLAKKLLELWEAELVLSAIIEEGYKNEFTLDHYTDIKEELSFERRQDFTNNSNFSERRNDFSNRANAPDWEIRLFVAKGNLDWLSPWSLIKFLESQTWKKLGNIWKIDVMREFSFINLSKEDSYMILDFFKNLNPRKPLVVEAKANSSWQRFDNSRNMSNSTRSYWSNYWEKRKFYNKNDSYQNKDNSRRKYN